MRSIAVVANDLIQLYENVTLIDLDTNMTVTVVCKLC